MFGIDDAILGQVAGAAVGGLLGGSSQGGTTEKTPWAPAAPWLQDQIKQGQNLQSYYQQNPFSQAQQQAYGNQFNLSDSYRQMMAQMMGQMSGNQGFNRANPTVKPQGYTFQAPQPVNLGFGGQMFAPIPQPISKPVPIESSPYMASDYTTRGGGD